jgi:hypothetical protein
MPDTPVIRAGSRPGAGAAGTDVLAAKPRLNPEAPKTAKRHNFLKKSRLSSFLQQKGHWERVKRKPRGIAQRRAAATTPPAPVQAYRKGKK